MQTSSSATVIAHSIMGINIFRFWQLFVLVCKVLPEIKKDKIKFSAVENRIVKIDYTMSC